MMAGLLWILALLCATGCHLSSSSPVLRSALVIQTGQNASLTCNLTSSPLITWYLFRSDRLLPLLTITRSKLQRGVATERFHAENTDHFSWSVDPESSWVSLEILGVEEQDAGHYFCVAWNEGQMRVNRGIQLTLRGADGATGDRLGEPCWIVGICFLLSLLSICIVVLLGLYLCAGKPAVCCCYLVKFNARLGVTQVSRQKESLHYSSVKHSHKPRPSARQETPLVEELVTYSTVMNRSQDRR